MTGFTEVDDLRYREHAMDACISPFEYRDVDCSSRSLATLMVAWVGAAMVASILLRWKYMWIALTILTLLFLFACGYAACNARRAHERAMANEENRIFEQNRRHRDIQSVSGSVDECREATEPPAYQSYWITDLPPPYAVVIGAEVPPPPPPPPMPRSSNPEPPSPTNTKPPPYSVAIQTDPIDVTQATSSPLRVILNRVGSSSSDPQNTSSRRSEEPTNSRTPQVAPVSTLAWHEDIKVPNEQTLREAAENSSNNSQTALTSGTIYLSNIISCTFARGQIRHNDERHDNLQTTMTNPTATRDRLAA
ncbi:uncharacterized protein [Venturia canescens]|uniref:uncharacterized protein isoform X2 n=1 Tax=Venturia canescens TaxID=32260 RepID=UPI001C9BDAF0|nr:uncharacterized protein LOC122415500 isoform X2 [Venturia canescens]XP_043283590.1 uncharacterized protein LOC122415500 isoform X2 [Venturia canescens]XP_043283600.1 uncharacterized protein LOC122415500 isoform X2 [Venturia canescens]